MIRGLHIIRPVLKILLKTLCYCFPSWWWWWCSGFFGCCCYYLQSITGIKLYPRIGKNDKIIYSAYCESGRGYSDVTAQRPKPWKKKKSISIFLKSWKSFKLDYIWIWIFVSWSYRKFIYISLYVKHDNSKRYTILATFLLPFIFKSVQFVQ